MFVNVLHLCRTAFRDVYLVDTKYILHCRLFDFSLNVKNIRGFFLVFRPNEKHVAVFCVHSPNASSD